MLKSQPIMKRHPANPILTPQMVPYPASLVFNAGVCMYQGRYVMVFRDDYGWDGVNMPGSYIGLAYSDDGVKWDIQPKPCMEWMDDEVERIYDPRLTVIDGRVYMCFALDTKHGLRAGIAVTEDFDQFDILHLTTPDNRNMVLFPEMINGMYMRLERPFPVYSRGSDRFDIWCSDSPDLAYWGNSKLVLGVEDIPFSNNKIGPGAQPVKTDRGWLCLIHSVDLDTSRGMNGWAKKPWQKRYCAGVMLLDLEDPSRVIGLSKEPLLVPETDYETKGGYRNDVIFPTGCLLEDSGEVKIYYGAADTTICLATCQLDELLDLCKPVDIKHS